MPFYYTVALNQDELEAAKKQTSSQATRIVGLFRILNIPMTPDEVHTVYCAMYSDTPLTSIRRAMTDLTEQNLLEKTPETKKGRYGMINHKWKLK